MNYIVCVLHVHPKEGSIKMWVFLHHWWFLHHFLLEKLKENYATCAPHLIFSVAYVLFTTPCSNTVLRKVSSLSLHTSC